MLEKSPETSAEITRKASLHFIHVHYLCSLYSNYMQLVVSATSSDSFLVGNIVHLSTCTFVTYTLCWFASVRRARLCTIHTARPSWFNVRDVLVGIAAHHCGQTPSNTSVSAFRQTIWPLRVTDDIGLCQHLCYSTTLHVFCHSFRSGWCFVSNSQRALHNTWNFTFLCFAVWVVHHSFLLSWSVFHYVNVCYTFNSFSNYVILFMNIFVWE